MKEKTNKILEDEKFIEQNYLWKKFATLKAHKKYSDWICVFLFQGSFLLNVWIMLNCSRHYIEQNKNLAAMYIFKRHIISEFVQEIF